MRPPAVEFLVHMSLCAAVSSINSLAEDGLEDRVPGKPSNALSGSDRMARPGAPISRSEHTPSTSQQTAEIRHQRNEHTSVTGARLDLEWRQLQNVEYLTDGGNSWIHTAVFNGKPVVVKTLKPECQDLALAINEIEGELGKLVVDFVCVEILAGNLSAVCLAHSHSRSIESPERLYITRSRIDEERSPICGLGAIGRRKLDTSTGIRYTNSRSTTSVLA